jgi:hypothetical protein
MAGAFIVFTNYQTRSEALVSNLYIKVISWGSEILNSLWKTLVKGKVVLCLTKHYDTKTYGGVGVQLHNFLISVLVGGEWSASHPCRFNPGERAPLYSLDRSPVQPAASRCTEWATAAPMKHFNSIRIQLIVTPNIPALQFSQADGMWKRHRHNLREGITKCVTSGGGGK